MLNSITANWRRFLLLLSTGGIVQRLLRLTDETTPKVLVADDTLCNRDHSKRVDLLARVQHDHNTGRYVRGFRMLTLRWSDAQEEVPQERRSLFKSHRQSRWFTELQQ